MNKDITKRVATLIVNKGAGLKAISKEIFKLGAIVGDIRAGLNAEQNLISIHRLDSIAVVNEKLDKLRSLQQAVNDKYGDWGRHPSANVINQATGKPFDQCALAYAYATDYVEVTEAQMKDLMAEGANYMKTISGGPEVHFCRNVLLTDPLVPGGFLHTRVQEWIASATKT